MIPATAVIAFLLLGIEEIGVQIEEPFSILPLGRLPDWHCMRCKCNIIEAGSLHSVVAYQHLPVQYIVRCVLSAIIGCMPFLQPWQ